MSFDIRLPNINATTEAEQIAQIRSYLYQFAEQLQWALNTVSTNEGGSGTSEVKYEGGKSSSSTVEDGAKNTFSEIKSLIIKSADIVEAYYKEFGTLLETEGKYVAASQFGTYYETSSKALVDKYDSLEQQHKDLQVVVDDMGKVVDGLLSEGIIKSGVIGAFTAGEINGAPIYGIEIRQKVTDPETGKELYYKLARLSAEGLELFGNPESNTPTAIFKYNTMYVTKAEISDSLKIGGYRISTEDGLSFTWEG